MQWHEKTAVLLQRQGRTRSAVSLQLKHDKNWLQSHLNRRSCPRADDALGLARVLNVPLEWLVDDKQPWPPPQLTGRRLDLLEPESSALFLQTLAAALGQAAAALGAAAPPGPRSRRKAGRQ